MKQKNEASEDIFASDFNYQKVNMKLPLFFTFFDLGLNQKMKH